MQVAGNMSWVHTALETGMTEVNVCYNVHKRRSCTCATHKKTNKPNRKWNWMSPGGRDRNMIDYILVQKNWVNGLTKYNNAEFSPARTYHQIILSFCATCPYS